MYIILFIAELISLLLCSILKTLKFVLKLLLILQILENDNLYKEHQNSFTCNSCGKMSIPCKRVFPATLNYSIETSIIEQIKFN